MTTNETDFEFEKVATTIKFIGMVVTDAVYDYVVEDRLFVDAELLPYSATDSIHSIARYKDFAKTNSELILNGDEETAELLEEKFYNLYRVALEEALETNIREEYLKFVKASSTYSYYDDLEVIVTLEANQLFTIEELVELVNM